MNWVDRRVPAAALAFFLPLSLAEPSGTVVAAAGRGGLWAFLLGFTLALLAALASALVARRHPDAGVGEILRAAWGAGPGMLAAGIQVLFWVVLAAWLLRYEATKVVDLLLPRTPLAVPVLALLALTVYLAGSGIEPVSRWAFAVLPAGLALVLPFYFLGLRVGAGQRLLELPPGGAGELVRAGLLVAGMLEGAALPLALAGWFEGAPRLPLAAAGGMGLGLVGLGTGVLLVFSLWGVAAAPLYHWPAVTAVQQITLPGFVVEKLDLVYLTGIGFLGVGRVVLTYLAAAVAARQLLPALSLRAAVLALAGPVLAAALWPLDFDTLTLVRLRLAPAVLAVAYLLPALTLVRTWLAPVYREEGRR